MVELSHHPNIIGIKESSGQYGEGHADDARVAARIPGDGGFRADAVAVAADGRDGRDFGFRQCCAVRAIAIWEAYRTREEEAGRDWQNRIARASSLVTTKYGIPGLKYAMDLNGYYGGPPRLPFTVPTAEAKREIEEAFQDLKG